jgi:hypothetical protein
MAESKNQPSITLARVVIKGLILFIVINLLFVPLSPIHTFDQLSAYNRIFPGRLRLPYGENPDQAYNLSLYDLHAMFTSHVLAAIHKPTNEYRVVLVGDSSVWGYLLNPMDTLSADINAAGMQMPNGRLVHAYNLGYPTLSLTKDLLMIKYAMQFQPDLIVWLVTLESFPVSKQLDSPILQNNPAEVQELISNNSLNLDPQDTRLVWPSFWGTTLIGERRALADLIRLQLYGVMWAATGIDQYYPETYEPPQSDLPNDETFDGLQPPQLFKQDLALDVLSAGEKLAANVPILFVNEPIYRSHGTNSDFRYNFFYPRWAYDQYRQILVDTCQHAGWQCLDEWDLVPPAEFTNSAIHMSPAGTQSLALEIEKAIITQEYP